jgi:hypothetical protein
MKPRTILAALCLLVVITTPTPSLTQDQPPKPTDEDIDRFIAGGIVDIQDARTAWLYTYTTVINKPNGYRLGVPRILVTMQEALRTRRAGLAKYTPAVPVQKRVLHRLANLLDQVSDILDNTAKAIRIAGEKSGFTRPANDLLAKVERVKSSVEPFPVEDVNGLLKRPVFADSIPELITESGDLTEASSTFYLGIETWTRGPNVVLVVHSESFAGKLGLQPGDVILTVDGKPVDDLLHFKNRVAERPGKQIRVVVMRDGQRREVSSMMPTVLPKRPGGASGL